MSGDDNHSSSSKARVKILFFAKARELAGRREAQLELPTPLSSAELKDQVVRGFSLESIQDIVILALNEEFVGENAKLNLSERDEIAVIPPLSGGMCSQRLVLLSSLNT